MNMKSITAFALIAGFAGSAVAAENTVLLTHGQGKGKQVATLDLQSSGEASAFQFAIQLPKGAKNIDTSACLSSLPKSHTGTCQASEKAGRVAVVVFSVNNSQLPAGMLELGEVRFQSAAKGSLALDGIVVAGPSGQEPLKATGRVESVDAPRTEVRGNTRQK